MQYAYLANESTPATSKARTLAAVSPTSIARWENEAFESSAMAPEGVKAMAPKRSRPNHGPSLVGRFWDSAM